MNNQSVTDYSIQTPKGKIFACSWKPKKTINRVPMVLFHDSLGCIQLWRDFPEVLANATGRQVFAYDRLGFGRSDKREDKPTADFIEVEAKEYFPLVKKALGLNEFIGFGHSVGGAMAVTCAFHQQRDCVAVITEAAQAFVEDRTLEGISVAKKNFEDSSQFSKIEKYHSDKALWVLRAWTDVWLSKEFSEWSLKEILPSLQCPLLAIHGLNDEYGSQKFPEMIANLSGGPSKKLILPDCGHVPHKERPNEVLSAVTEFLENLSSI